MSNISLEQFLVMIEQNLTANDDFRREMQRQSFIQLMDLNEPLFISTTMAIGNVNAVQAKNIYDAIAAIFEAHQTKTVKKKSNTDNPSIKFKIEKAQNLKINYPDQYGASYIVDTYRWVEENLYSNWAKEIAKVTATTDIKNLQLKLSNLKAGGANIEHGGKDSSGNPTGTPMAGARAVYGFAFMANSLQKIGLAEEKYAPILKQAFKNRPSSLRLNVIYNTELTEHMRIDSDQVLLEYVFSLKLGSAADNNASSSLEGSAADIVRKQILPRVKQLLKEEGITTINNALVAEVIKGLSLNYKGKKGDTKTVINKAVKGQIKEATTIDVNKITAGSLPPGPKAQSSSKVANKTALSDLQIKKLLNAKLTDAIRRRMTYPRLVYRTGRFASSVEVIGLTSSNDGKTTLSYTYAKDPYQIFEEGHGRVPWATPARDPRIIIEESIREVAIGIIAGKFNLRRN